MSLLEKLGITPGRWRVHNNGPHWNNKDLVHYEIHWSYDGECVCDTVYKLADARLIAQAPKMLKALIELYHDWKHIDYTDPDVFIKPIIESATGKTWEEIKELL